MFGTVRVSGEKTDRNRSVSRTRKPFSISPGARRNTQAKSESPCIPRNWCRSYDAFESFLISEIPVESLVYYSHRISENGRWGNERVPARRFISSPCRGPTCTTGPPAASTHEDHRHLEHRLQLATTTGRDDHDHDHDPPSRELPLPLTTRQTTLHSLSTGEPLHTQLFEIHLAPGFAVHHGKSTTNRYALPPLVLALTLVSPHGHRVAFAVDSTIAPILTQLWVRSPACYHHLIACLLISSLPILSSLLILSLPSLSSPRWRYRLPQGRLCCPKLPRVPIPLHRGTAHSAYRREGRRRLGHGHQGHHVW